MKLAYLLDRPELGGGVKVVFQHAELLRQHGYEVAVLGRGPAPDWRPYRGRYIDYEHHPPSSEQWDLVLTTYWTTVGVALDLRLGPLAHFCQGYEGHLVHLSAHRSAIDAVYGLDMPTVVVSPHLGSFLAERFHRHSVVVPPPHDPRFHPALRWRPRRCSWVILPGIFEAEVKGVPTGLEAMARLRRGGLPCRLLRISVLPLSAAERSILEPDLYLCAVSPLEVARALRKADLLLFPSRGGEGFGLPVLEAMASGLPVVASSIPSTTSMAADALRLVPAEDSGAFATSARELLTQPRLWRRSRRAGLVAVKRYAPEVVANQLIAAVQWARDRAHEVP